VTLVATYSETDSV